MAAIFREELRMTFRLILFLAFGFTLLIGDHVTGHAAQSDNWNTPYDELFAQPGAEVSIYLNEKGLEERKLIIPGKTLIIQTREKEEVSTIVHDISGLGAVRCAWMIYVEARAGLEAFSDLESPVAAERLDMAIGQINKFIIENSVEEWSVEQLDKAYQARVGKLRQAGSEAEGRDFIEDLVRQVAAMPEEQFERDIGKFLSLPRLPALSPCL
jgi:hypothetical protein